MRFRSNLRISIFIMQALFSWFAFHLNQCQLAIVWLNHFARCSVTLLDAPTLWVKYSFPIASFNSSEHPPQRPRMIHSQSWLRSFSTQFIAVNIVESESWYAYCYHDDIIYFSQSQFSQIVAPICLTYSVNIYIAYHLCSRCGPTSGESYVYFFSPRRVIRHFSSCFF